MAVGPLVAEDAVAQLPAPVTTTVVGVVILGSVGGTYCVAGALDVVDAAVLAPPHTEKHEEPEHPNSPQHAPPVALDHAAPRLTVA